MTISEWIAIVSMIGAVVIALVKIAISQSVKNNQFASDISALQKSGDSIPQLMGLLNDLKLGQALTHQQLEQLVKEVENMKIGNDKVRELMNENHNELTILKTDIENLKKQFKAVG